MSKEKRFVATYSQAVQIGEYEFRQVKTSRVFNYSDSFNDVMGWLKCIGVKEPTLSSVDISEMDE